MMATRGRRRTISHGTFMAAASPTSRAVSTRPASSSTSPFEKSSPAGRTHLPALTVSLTVTAPSLASQSSWMAMQSAPSGIGAPVKMRAASPLAIGPAKPRPAEDSPMTARVAGTAATSAARTA